MSKLNQVVFLIEDGKIRESKIRDLDGYIDETTTPRGIGPRHHTRGNELWTWGHAGNFPRMLETFDTDEEAEAALEESFYYDFKNCVDLFWFWTREEAQTWLDENAE